MPSIRWTRFEREMLLLYAPPMRRPATARKVRQVLREIRPYCRTTRDLTPSTVAGWLSEHDHRATATHRSLLAALRAACSYGASRGYLADPFAFRRVRSWLPEDELEPDEPF